MFLPMSKVGRGLLEFGKNGLGEATLENARRTVDAACLGVSDGLVSALFSIILVVIVSLVLCIVLTGCESDPEKRPAPSRLSGIAKIIDVPSIALKPRSAVEAVLGKPVSFKVRDRHDPSERGDRAIYQWGELIYMEGVLCFLNYRFTPPPADYRAALAELGLPDGPAPYLRPVDQNRIWSSWSHVYPSFNCCEGLEFSDMLITGDLSEIDIWLFAADWPKTWTSRQKLMWKQRTSRPLPRS